MKKKKPKTTIKYVLETLKGKRIDKNFYSRLDFAEQSTPLLPVVIWKIWVIESQY